MPVSAASTSGAKYAKACKESKADLNRFSSPAIAGTLLPGNHRRNRARYPEGRLAYPGGSVRVPGGSARVSLAASGTRADRWVRRPTLRVREPTGWVRGWRRTSWHVSRILFPGRLAARGAAAIHLGLPSPAGSSGLPAGSDGPSSNACAGARGLPLGLAPGGVYLAVPVTRDAGGLLHHRFTLTPPSRAVAVCFLWHFPAGHPGLPLATTLPCGVRTFLGPGRPGPRPPCQLVRGWMVAQVSPATARRLWWRGRTFGRRRLGRVAGAGGPARPSSAAPRRGCRGR